MSNELEKRKNHFLQWEASTDDIIVARKVYLAMADDLIAGLVLSRIVYFHLPSKKTGAENKLRVVKNGRMWIAKAREAWWDELWITPKQVDRAIAILEGKKLVDKSYHLFAGSRVMHIALNWSVFLKLHDQALKDGYVCASKPRSRAEMDANTAAKKAAEKQIEGKPAVTKRVTGEAPKGLHEGSAERVTGTERRKGYSITWTTEKNTSRSTEQEETKTEAKHNFNSGSVSYNDQSYPDDYDPFEEPDDSSFVQEKKQEEAVQVAVWKALSPEQMAKAKDLVVLQDQELQAQRRARLAELMKQEGKSNVEAFKIIQKEIPDPGFNAQAFAAAQKIAPEVVEAVLSPKEPQRT